MKKWIVGVLLVFATLVWALIPHLAAAPVMVHAVLTVSPNPACVGDPVEFDACGSYHDDPGIAIVLYELDFDGDGVYDWSSPTACLTTHTYMMEHVYVPVLRVTDELGNFDEGTVELIISGASAAEASTWGQVKSLYR